MVSRKNNAKRQLRETPHSSDPLLPPAPLNTDIASPSRHSRTAGQDAVLINELGVNPAALLALNKKGRTALLDLIKSGPNTAALAIRIVNAVNRTSPSRENEVLTKLYDYPGSLTVLECFLNNLGTNDPFIATQRAQVILLPASHLPQNAQITDDLDSRPEVQVSVRGASGHIIHGMVYCAYNQDSPAASAGFFSKRQAVTRPFETFNPEKYNPAARTQVREGRARSYCQILRDLSLLDLERNPALVEAAHSPLLARDFAVYQELKAAIAAYKQQHSSLVYGERIDIEAVNALNLRTDPGGTLLGWYTRQIEAGMVLPPGIQAAYESLQDPDIRLDPETERDYLRGLIAFQKVNSFISKETALSGAAADIEEFDGLAQDDSLRLDFSIEQAKRTLQELAQHPGGELRVSEFGAVVSLGGLDKFRRTMNLRTLDTYRSEFTEALRRFEPLFIKDGRWLNDALGQSIPMTRLSNSIYGARIGVAQSWHGENDKRALLGQPDFKALRDAMFQRTVTQGNPDHVVMSMPIAAFRSMVEGVVRAYRKARYLDAKLDQLQAARQQAGQDSLLFDWENLGGALSDWKPVLPLGTDLRPKEAFMTTGSVKVTPIISLQDLVACIKCRGLGGRELKGALAEIQIQAKAGLFSPRYEKALRSLIKEALRYTPASRLAAEITVINQMMQSPLVTFATADTRSLLKKSHLSNPEVLEIQLCAGFAPLFDAVGLSPDSRIKILGQRLEQVRGTTIYTGHLACDSDRRPRIEATSQALPDFVGLKSANKFYYYEPQLLEQKLNELEADYVRGDSLSTGWLERAKTLCSAKGKDLLQVLGCTLVDRNTFYTMSWLQPTKSVFVSKAFVGLIDTLWHQASTAGHDGAGPEKKSPMTGSIGPSTHFQWQGLAGRERTLFGFGRYKGQAVADVVNRMLTDPNFGALSYFSDFLAKGNFPPHVSEIAAKVVELGRRGTRFPEFLFKEWLVERQKDWGAL